MTTRADDDRWIARARDALGRPRSPFHELPHRLVAVDVERQRLALIEAGRVHARIGDRAETGTEFRSRVPTGRRWRGEPADEDLMLTRILTLDGLEPGVNQGPGHDSLERYIYIHGTNHEAALGRADSHGCI